MNVSTHTDSARNTPPIQAKCPEPSLLQHPLGPHAEIARSLGLPEPAPGEWVSQRVARLKPEHGASPSVVLAGEAWTKAGPEDAVEESPDLNTVWRTSA
ncbi:NaeI family type II restriction endonuclease [Streptomyces sp. NPDC055796]